MLIEAHTDQFIVINLVDVNIMSYLLQSYTLLTRNFDKILFHSGTASSQAFLPDNEAVDEPK